MKLTITSAVALVALIVSTGAPAQTKPTAPTVATTLPSHWEEIDQRFVFFTVQLASVETSLDAVNKALKVAGYHQTAQQQKAAMHQQGNEQMDRNGGGPVRWDQFYGRTAEEFYHATDIEAGAAGDSNSSLAYVSAHADRTQRPPQFDYIYRANLNAQQRAEDEVAKLGGQIDALLERRRQLELEQAANWSKIAFQAVASHKLDAKPTYRFVLKVDGQDPVAKQQQTALRAAADFVRGTLRAVADAEEVVDNDPAATFDALHHVVATASSDFNDKLLHCPKLALDAGDATTSLGRVVASTERLADVTKNIADSYHSALEGDQSGDDHQKQTFRAYAQQALFDCATNVFATSQYVTTLGREWKGEIDVDKPQRDLPPTAVAKVAASTDAKPSTPAAGATASANTVASAANGANAKGPIKLTRSLPYFLIATGTFSTDKDGIRPAKNTVVATKSPDFLGKDFIFDVYVTVPKKDDEDAITVGLGDLTEKGSVRILIHKEGGWGQRAFLTHGDREGELMGDIHEAEAYVVRLERHAGPITASIGSITDGQFTAELTQTVSDLKEFAPDLSDKRAHLYFSGQAPFSQVRLVSGPAASNAGVAAHASATPDKTAGAAASSGASSAASPAAAVANDADAAKGIYHLTSDKLPASFTATGTFSVTPAGLKCYDNKCLIISKDKDFLSKDFIFEATVDVPEKLDRDEIIIGLGDGTEKGSLRMIIRVEGGWPERAYLHLGDREGKNFGDIREAGPRTLRIERHGTTVTTSVGTEKEGKFDAELSQTVADAKTAVTDLSERYAHIFFTGKPPWSQIRLVTGAAAAEPAPTPTTPDDQPKKPGKKRR